MDLSWEKICRPKSWNSLTEDERTDVKLHMNKTSYTLEELKTILKEHRKYIASRFEGPTTLISNHVLVTNILNSNEYEVNLRLTARIEENKIRDYEQG